MMSASGGGKPKPERRGFRSRVRSILNQGKSSTVSSPRSSSRQRRSSDDKGLSRSSSLQGQPSDRRPFSPSLQDTNSVLWQKAQDLVSAESPKAWFRFEDSFKSSDIISFDDIIGRLENAIRDCDNHKWRVPIPLSGSVITPRDVLDKILGYIEAFKDVGKTVASLDPTQSAGIAWNALQCLVTLAVKHQKTRDLVEKYESVSNLVFRCSLYVALYLDVNHDGGADDLIDRLSDAILTAYIRVLRYLMAALNFIGQWKDPLLGHAAGSLAPSNIIEQSMEDILRSEREIDRWQTAAQARTDCSTNQTAKKLLEIVLSIDQPLRQAFQHLESLVARDGDRDRDQFWEWISNQGYEARYEEVRSGRMGDTGLWLLSNPNLIRWQKSDQSCVLWLSGIMGSGKSVVTSLVVDQILSQAESPDGTPLAYFFCDRTSRQDQLTRTSIIYRFLLRQLLETCQAKAPNYLYGIYRRDKGRRPLNDTDLLSAMVEVINDCGNTVVIVIDALDECDLMLRSALLAGLQHLISNTKGCLKIFISSRQERDISDVVAKQPVETTFLVTMQNEQDISAYITRQVDRDFELKRFPAWFLPIREQIIEGLISKSQGMFRWAQLSLQALYQKKGTPESILKRLAELPPGLEELYSELYASMAALDDFDLVRKTLVFIMHARVPLSATELVEAVFCQSPSVIPKDHQRSLLLDHCSHFVEWEQDAHEIRLAHASVCLELLWSYEHSSLAATHKKWTLNHFVSYVLAQWPYHVWQTAIHSNGGLQDLTGRFDRLQFASTAMGKWIERALFKVEAASATTQYTTPSVQNSPEICDSPISMASQSPASSVESFADSLRTNASELEGSLKNMLARNTSQPSNPLFTFSVWKLPGLVDDGITIEEEAWTIKNEKGDTAMEDFCASTSVSSLEKLLWRMSAESRKAILSREPHFVQSIIIRDVDEATKLSLIRKLLSAGATFNRGDSPGRSALHCAAGFDLAEIIAILVENGANVDAVDHSNATPLHQACAMGSLMATRQLWAYNATSSIRDNEGRTPIFIAAEHRQWHIVHFLITWGVEVNDRDATGRTMLHHTAEAGPLSVADKLISAGADVNAKIHLLEEGTKGLSGISGTARRATRRGLAKLGLTPLHYTVLRKERESFDLETALHIAARLSRTNIACRLLELGASFEELTSNGESVLLLASHAAEFDLVINLHRRGANPFVCDKYGRNAFHYAAMGNHGETFALFRSLLGSRGAVDYINAPDMHGTTLLHFAATARWKAAFITLLLDMGANINARDHNGKTPADIAEEEGQATLENYLRRRATSADPSDWPEMPFGPADFLSRPPSVASSFHDDDSDTARAMRRDQKTRKLLDQTRRVKRRRKPSLSMEDYIAWRLPEEESYLD